MKKRIGEKGLEGRKRGEKGWKREFKCRIENKQLSEGRGAGGLGGWEKIKASRATDGEVFKVESEL